ncbi:MAG: hypothetical protein R2878_11240 [Thermoleophilia bacterium]
MNLHGLRTLVFIQWRTGWKGIASWIVGAVGMMLLTAIAIKRLYPDAAALAGYAATQDNPTSYMLNGKIAGLGTLGGVMANEFSFLGAFLFPLMGVALVTRGTRRDEELGRLELLLSNPVGRQAPQVAAVLTAVTVALVSGLGCSAVMAAYGVPVEGALAFGIGFAGVGIVFAAIAAAAAQIVERSRAVWMVGMGSAVAAYVLRGVGDVYDLWVRWLSPLGWADSLRPFGALRWWPVAVTVAVSAAVLAGALLLNARRDLGDALIRGRPASPTASRSLLDPLGRALILRRGVIISWTLVTVVLMGIYGAFTDQIIKAIEKNPNLEGFLGSGLGTQLLERVMDLFLMILAFIVAGFVVQGVLALRGDEEQGLVEYELAGAMSRHRWLAVRLLAVVIGAVVVGATGAAAVAITTAMSTGTASDVGKMMAGSVWLIPAIVIFLALAAAIIGVLPRYAMAGWAFFAVAILLAYLGPGFNWPTALVNVSPFRAIGERLVGGHASIPGVAALLGLSAVLLVIAFAGFRRRDVPRT